MTIEAIAELTLGGILLLAALGAYNRGTYWHLLLALVLSITAAVLFVVALFTILDLATGGAR